MPPWYHGIGNRRFDGFTRSKWHCERWGTEAAIYSCQFLYFLQATQLNLFYCLFVRTCRSGKRSLGDALSLECYEDLELYFGKCGIAPLIRDETVIVGCEDVRQSFVLWSDFGYFADC